MVRFGVKATTLCSASSGKRTPLARPTAATSAEARSEQRCDVRIFAQYADRRPGRSRERRIGRQQDELHPQLGHDLVAVRRIEARFLTQREKVLTPSAMAAFEFAKYQTHEVAGLPDHAGLGDRGADLRHSAHHRRRTEDGDQALRGIDAVLQWKSPTLLDRSAGVSTRRRFRHPKA